MKKISFITWIWNMSLFKYNVFVLWSCFMFLLGYIFTERIQLNVLSTLIGFVLGGSVGILWFWLGEKLK